MVKIIKRIIVGVGIALVLSCFSKFGLIGNVYALSCDVSGKTNQTPITNIRSSITNNTTDTGASLSYYRQVVVNNQNETKLKFNENDSYIDVQVSGAWVMGYFNETHYTTQSDPYPNQPLQSHLQASPPLLYLEDNTKNPNNNAWTLGSWDGAYWNVRYYKKDYPNSDTINLTAVRIAIPTWYYNYTTEVWVLVNSTFSILHYECDSNQALQNAIDENTQAVQETTDTIKDDTVDNDKADSDLEEMNSKVASNNSITQLLTLPIQLYQNILNGISGGCSVFNLGTLYNHEINLPCINLQNILGGTLFSIIDILISGLFILSFRKKMVDIFNNMTSLKDRGNELE